MRTAVERILDLDAAGLLRYGATSVALTTALWDAPARRECLARTAAAARDAGALQLLDTTLWTMSLAELSGGTPRHAHEYIEQVRELRRAIGYDAEHVINVALLAWAEAPRAQVEMIADGAGSMGFYGVRSAGQAGLAVRDLAEGDYDGARHRLEPLVADPFLQVTALQLPDYVEAACRSGRAPDATAHVRHLEGLARVNGSSWTAGVAHRSRALVEEDAEPHHRAAVEALAAGDVPMELGRAHLLYGEWLRRAKRRRAPGSSSTWPSACSSAAGSGLRPPDPREETAIGDQIAPAGVRDPRPRAEQLTVARLAATGHTNAEIGATMSLSPNTVDYHLRNVFHKLGISSRRSSPSASTVRTERPGTTVRTMAGLRGVRGPRGPGLRHARRHPDSSPAHPGGPMPYVTADDGARIFYKDWGSTAPPSSSATAGRSTRTPGRPPPCSSPSTDTARSPTTVVVTDARARRGTATRWTPTPTTWPAWSRPSTSLT